MIQKLRKKCGNNLDCLISVKDDNEKISKEVINNIILEYH